MGRFSEIGFRIDSPKRTLLFLLGMFSTMQILQVAGFALSTWLTVLTAGYLLLTQGLEFRKDWHLLALLVFTGVTFAVSMVSDIPVEYKKASITGTLQWGLIFVICSCVHTETYDDSTASFFRGFDWSCRIQLVWCVLQMGAWYVLKLDINTKIFGDLLHMSHETSQFRKGVLACTGLHWHAANLIPVLIYTYFRYRNVFVKLLCFVIVYLTKNATALIAIGGALGLDLVLFAKQTLCDRHCAIRYKVAIYIMLGAAGLLAVSPILLPKLWESVEYLLQRIYQIWNPTAGNESSAVHFNYYKNLTHILQNIPVREVLFGSGIGTSGYRFTQFYHQYPDLIWVVESNFVDAVLSRGMVGMLLQYALQIRIAWHSVKTKRTWITCFMIVLLVSGFIYNNQFLWVQLLSYMLYCISYQSKREGSAWTNR